MSSCSDRTAALTRTIGANQQKTTPTHWRALVLLHKSNFVMPRPKPARRMTTEASICEGRKMGSVTILHTRNLATGVACTMHFVWTDLQKNDVTGVGQVHDCCLVDQKHGGGRRHVAYDSEERAASCHDVVAGIEYGRLSEA